MQLYKRTKCIGVRHIQILLVFLGTLLSFSMRSVLPVAVVAMTSAETSNPDFPELNWDMNKQSWILSATMWGCLVSKIPMGFLASSRPHSFLLYSVLGSSFITALTPVLALHGGWVAIFCSRLIMGIVQGCTTSCMMRLTVNWSSINERASAGSLVFNSPQIGRVIALVVAGVLCASRFGWPSIFYTYGVMGITWSILYYYYGADSPIKYPSISVEEKEYIKNGSNKLDDDHECKQHLKFPWRAIIKSLPVWVLVATHVCNRFSYFMLENEIPFYMKSILGFNIQKNGTISALPPLVMWLTAFPLSWSSDFALRKGAPVTVVRKISNTIGMWGPCLALMALCLLRTTDQTTLIIILVVAVGLNAGTTCGYSINEMDIAPNFSAQLGSINETISLIFGALSPIICSYIVTDQKNEDQWYIVFWILVALYFVGNLGFIVFAKATPQPWNDPQLQKRTLDDKL